MAGGDIKYISEKIYLLLKQHNRTKLKYLCKRVTHNVMTCHSYQGSGKRWKAHISKHGYDVTTTILGAYDSLKEFKKDSIYYSNLWDVANNPAFANLIPEQGDGGNTWYGPNTSQRREAAKERMKRFHLTEKGKTLRKNLAITNKQNQTGIMMETRMKTKDSNWKDPRKGKKFKEIYKEGYQHPQQKPFVIKLKDTNSQWTCLNEADFFKQLNMYPSPSLTTLKKDGFLVIKVVSEKSKHQFKKGDVLTLEYINA